MHVNERPKLRIPLRFQLARSVGDHLEITQKNFHSLPIDQKLVRAAEVESKPWSCSEGNGPAKGSWCSAMKHTSKDVTI